MRDIRGMLLHRLVFDLDLELTVILLLPFLILHIIGVLHLVDVNSIVVRSNDQCLETELYVGNPLFCVFEGFL